MLKIFKQVCLDARLLRVSITNRLDMSDAAKQHGEDEQSNCHQL
ncbi:hypothetical protein PEPIB2_101 (plasmid) [Tritonibacter mobilis]|nr:hypothetical protein PEPIB2_101 [Tritonibacter mobilis]